MRLRDRSFPHPVVGNADDVPSAAFQATYEISSDREYYYIVVTVACGSKTVSRLVEKEEAAYVLHAECSNTMYRRAFEFTGDKHRAQIPANHVNGAVELNVVARSKRDIANYRLDGAHPDYGTTGFRIRNGDIIAIAEGMVFEAETIHDSLRRIGSIMVIEQSTKNGDHPLELDLNNDKIRILLCERDFDTYRKLKGVPHLTSLLTTTIVLPVLTEALHAVASNQGEFENLKWHQCLERRLDELHLGGEGEVLAKAQSILDMPIRRALGAAEVYSSNTDA